MSLVVVLHVLIPAIIVDLLLNLLRNMLSLLGKAEFPNLLA
jgi:hypothetical protein